jgi:uncharacterized glyoxalase superfamily protein PhnB
MLVSAVPVLQSLNINDTVEFYEKKLGFSKLHQEDGFAILYRDEVYINFTGTTDKYLPDNTACRINVTDVESLYRELEPKGIIHPNAPLETTDWGTKEFAIVDVSGNLITFSERLSE